MKLFVIKLVVISICIHINYCQPREEPSFRNEPQNTTALENTLAKLRCLCRGYPKPDITWTFNDQVMMTKASNKYKINKSGTLRIMSAQIEDAGWYRCKAVNIYGTVTSEQVYLKIQAPAEILDGPKNLTVSWGSHVIINCTTRGLPTPVVSWKVNGKPLIDKVTGKLYSKYSITKNVTENATYECTVGNHMEDSYIEKTSPLAYVSYNEHTRPIGFCSSMLKQKISICDKYISAGSTVFLNYTYQHPIQMNENLLKYLFESIDSDFNDGCQEPLKSLLCQSIYPECENSSRNSHDEPKQVCKESCEEVQETYCSADWGRLRSHVSHINSQSNKWAYFKPLDCHRLPTQHCMHLQFTHLASTPSLSGSLRPPVAVRSPESGGMMTLTFVIITGIAGIVVLGLLVIVAIFTYKLCKKNRGYTDYLTPVQHNKAASFNINIDKLTKNSFYQRRLPSSSSSIVRLEELEFPRNEIVFLGDIGKGAFGKLFKARANCWVRGHFEDRTITVKMLWEDATEYSEECLKREADLMCELDHPNIVKLIGVCLQDQPMCLIYEYMNEGDLTEFLRQHSPQYFKFNVDKLSQDIGHLRQLNTIEQLDMSIQIASGMLYLSSKGFIHRDLATRNCLVGDHLIVKISDFALMKTSEDDEYFFGKDLDPVPIRWMAPEAVFFNKFSSASDVWSFGVVLWEIFSFAMEPYYELTKYEDVITYIKEGNILSSPEDTPEEIYEIMKQCWSYSASDRPKFSSLYYRLSSLRQQHKYTDDNVHFNNGQSDKSAIYDDGNSL